MSATLLPPGEQQFCDSNGKPLAGGKLYFYIPNTTTPKNTWQDPAQTILNTNPVVLDASGRAIIWGSGTYRQQLYDQFGNLIWDQITEDTSGGLLGNMVDDIFVAGTDFTPGTTTQLTLTAGPGSIANTWIYFDATYQDDAQATLNGTTLTFASAIPVGVNKVTVKIGSTIAIGVPGNGTVGAAQIAANSVGDGQLAWGNTLGRVCDSITALQVLNISIYTRAFVTGYYAAGDGGGGPYVYSASTAQSKANGGTIIAAAGGVGCWILANTTAVSIKQFGAKMDGTTDDSSAINSAILGAIANNFKLYAPAGVANTGTTTILFPNTMQEGFCFEADPDFTIQYKGTGDAVKIDSCYNARIILGRVICTGGTSFAANAIHINPTGVGANGQNVCVVSTFGFEMLGGAKVCLALDNTNGSISQCDINGIYMNNGFGQPNGSMTGNMIGVSVYGASPYIFQGNRVSINYLVPGNTSYAGGAAWIAINDGSSTFGPSLDNVNQFFYGAIDGASFNNSYGVVAYGSSNQYNGPIVDMQVCIQWASGSFGNEVNSSGLNINAGGTIYQDLTGKAGANKIDGAAWKRQYGITASTGTIAAGGQATLSITFANAFALTPLEFGASLYALTGTSQMTCYISSLTSTGMNVTVSNLAGISGTAQVSYFAEGI